jgi:hypothetical protein
MSAMEQAHVDKDLDWSPFKLWKPVFCVIQSLGKLTLHFAIACAPNINSTAGVRGANEVYVLMHAFCVCVGHSRNRIEVRVWPVMFRGLLSSLAYLVELTVRQDEIPSRLTVISHGWV